MILGISLVVQELNKGPRLLFRYPEESSSYYHRAFQTAVESGKQSGPPIIKAKKITIPTVNDIASNDGLLHTSKSATVQNVDAAPAPVQRSTASIRLNQIYEQYFGLSDENFAKLFRAKNALLGKFLDFAVGDLHFVSFPCTCPLSAPGTSHEDSHHKSYAEAVIGSQAASNNSEEHSDRDLISSFSIVIATVSRKAMLEIQKDFIYKCQSKNITLPGEDPIAAAMGLRTKLTGVCNASIKRLLATATQSLCAQEKKCRYLTKEISRILQIIDSHRNDPQQIANSDHITKIMEINYFDARSASVDAEEDDSNMKLPIALGVVEFGRSRRSSSNTSNQHSTASLNPVSTASNLPGQTWTTESSESAAEVASVDGDKRRILQTQTPGNVTNTNPKLIQSNPTRFLCHNILMESNLANELKSLFHGVAGFHGVNISFNGSKLSHLQLICKEIKSCEDSQGVITDKARGVSASVPAVFRPPALMPPTVTKIVVGGEKTLNPSELPPKLPPAKQMKRNSRPWYETMLLLGDAESVLAVLETLESGVANLTTTSAELASSLPAPASTTIRKANTPTSVATTSRQRNSIRSADPTQSFMDLSFQLDQPVDELTDLASYLQSWGLAEIIPTIYAESCYKVHPSAPLSANSRVAKAFEALITSFDITEINDVQSQPTTSIATRKRSTSYSGTTSTIGTQGVLGGKKHSNDPFSFRTVDDLIDSEFLLKSNAGNRPQHQPNAPLSTILEQPIAGSTVDDVQTNQVGDIPKTNVEDLDDRCAISQSFSLTRILSLFDGNHTLKEILLPLPLQSYLVDIVVFLLRWHMLIQVNYYFVNLVAMPSTAQELLDEEHPVNHISPPPTNNYQRKQRRDSFDEMKSGSLGLYLSDSERSLEIDSHFAEGKKKPLQLDGQRSNLTSIIQELDETFTFMNNVHTLHLTAEERQTLSKIAPYIEHKHISAKTVSEILWITKVNGHELRTLLKKLPYLKTIKKMQ